MNRGFYSVDESMMTSTPGIYAVGDCNGISMLAHSAFGQGIAAAHNCAGQVHTMDHSFIPSCVYTSPEIAGVGLLEEAAQQIYDIETAVYSIASNGKAATQGEREGFIKLIAKKDGALLGAHMFLPHSTEMISLVAMLIKSGTKADDIKNAVFAHPTLSECVWECAREL